MLILLTIFTLIFTSLAMLILHLVRPRLSIQGFLSVLAVLVGLGMVFLARSEIPENFLLLQWEPKSLFSSTPSLIIDDISWYFAFTLVSLAFTVVITSIAQLGLSTKNNQYPIQTTLQVGSNSNSDPNGKKEATTPAASGVAAGSGQMPNWAFWLVVLVLTSVGLLAVTAGNLLTLILAWAALDMIELVVLLGVIPRSEDRERVIIVFTARLVGIVTVLIAGLLVSSQGGILQLNPVPQSISVILIVAAAIRLGVFLPQHRFMHGLPIRSDLAVVMNLISAATCYILLVRVSSTGITPSIAPYILGFFILVGLYAGFRWLGSEDGLDGRPYWMLGTASLAIAAAVVNSPFACLAWSLASILSGGLIFSFSLRHRNFIPLIILGVFNFSTLPFSPTWQATVLYQSISSITGNRVLSLLFFISILIIQALLLSGYIRHFLVGIFPQIAEKSRHIERWVWVLYPLGLLLLVATHLLMGWFLLPDLNGLTLVAWIIGPLNLLIAALILFISWRLPRAFLNSQKLAKTSVGNTLFSFEWLYNLIWISYRTISRLFAVVSNILEGDGGILWALVLFALIFVFLQR
jgi:hypothetical protein